MLRVRVEADEDRGVSPVIGVVLMVALTVLLGSVVATTLFDVVEDAGLDAPVGAAVTVDGGDGVAVAWVSNTRADKLRVEFTTEDDDAVVFLRRVGASVTLGPDGFTIVGGSVARGSDLTVERGDSVQVTVTAQTGDQRTLIVRRTMTG